VLEEPFVGDRQFRITRPYAWQSLLGAKALFLLDTLIAAPGAKPTSFVSRTAR